jgi:hypothetical protein
MVGQALVEGSGMPSFSRSGKTYSNKTELAMVQAVFERDRAEKARGRPALDYVSLAETAARTTNYAEDLGRNSLISSSPRLPDEQTKTTKNEGLLFQRVLKWSAVPGEEYDPNIPPQTMAASKQKEEAYAKDKKKKPTQQLRPSSFFLATERFAPNDYLEQLNKQVGKLAPPVGYYDVKLDLTKPAGPRLGYIVQEDRPHAPTFLAETLVKERLVKSQKELTLKDKTNSGKQHINLTPQMAVRLLRDTTPNTADLSQCSIEESKKSQSIKEAKHKLHEDEEDDRAKSAMTPDQTQGQNMSPVASPQTRPRTSSPTSGSRIFDKDWDKSRITIDMKGRTPRDKEDLQRLFGRQLQDTGMSTCTGYQYSKTQSADVWYRPNFEPMQITQKRCPTPDLSRSGKDFDDQLNRLGFRQPEILAQMPWYSKVDSHMDYTKMPGWFTNTRPMDNRTSVQIGKQTQRRPLSDVAPYSQTEAAIDTGVRIQFRNLNPKTNPFWKTVGCDDKHPTYPHVPGDYNLQKSKSAHGKVENKSTTTHLNYYPSHRLMMQRTTGVLPFNKMGKRVSAIAHPHTGKPLRNVSEIFYDTHDAEMGTIRPRVLSPVNMTTDLDREAGATRAPLEGPEHKDASHLSGAIYWDGVSALTSSIRQLDNKRMPCLDRTQGREAFNPRDQAYRTALQMTAMLDDKVREPISTVGKEAFDNGHKTGKVWQPK